VLPDRADARSSWGYFLGSQFLTLDMGLTFFLTVASWFPLDRRTGIPLARGEVG